MMVSRSRIWLTEGPVLGTGYVWRAGCYESSQSGSEGGGWSPNTVRCSGPGRLPYTGERLLALPPGRWDEAALMSWLEGFIGRGSSLDVPVREMPRIYRELNAPQGRTDVLFVTDALCRIPADLQQEFLAWKAEVRARLITLVIGSTPGDLGAISDETYQVGSLSVTEE